MRVAEQLAARGHEPLVIAPESARGLPPSGTGFPVIRVPSVGPPLYPGFRVGLAGAPVRLAEIAWMATKGTAWVARRSTDLVPYLLAMAAAEMLGSARRGSHVVGEPREHAAQAGDFLLADAAAQALVEVDGGGAERHEHLISSRRELHDVDAAVRWIALTADQACCLHGAEVVGQRRLPDPDRLS